MGANKHTCIGLAVFLFCCSAYFLFLTSRAIGNSNEWTDLYFIVPTIALVVAANFYAAMATVKGGSHFYCGLITYFGNMAFALPLGHVVLDAAVAMSTFIFYGSWFYRQYSAGRLAEPAQG